MARKIEERGLGKGINMHTCGEYQGLFDKCLG